MLDINYTLFIQIANFLFLLFILNILLFKPIRKILGERSHEMGSYEGQIGDFRGKSDQYEKELQENMVGARKEGFQEKEGLKNEGLGTEKELLQEATSAAGEKIGKAKQDIESKAGDARATLENEVAAFSKELAEKILGRSI